MPVNNFTVGKDISFSIQGPNGTLTLNGVTDYVPKPIWSDLKHKGLDGLTQHAPVPDGWEIDVKLDRQDNNVDMFFATLEANYFAGQNLISGSVTESIKEKDGSITQFQYQNATFKLNDAGSYKGDALVPQSMCIYASRRVRSN
jgi:hypothetical protein